MTQTEGMVHEVETFEMPVMVTRIEEMIKRLGVRGRITLRMEMTTPLLRKVWDGRQTTSEFSQVTVPYWYVSILKNKRRYYNDGSNTISQIEAYVWDQFGMNSEFAEGHDLSAVLQKLLIRTEPHRDELADLVYSKFTYKESEEGAS